MNSVAFSEADITVTGINNLLLRQYEPHWRYVFESRPSCALYYIQSGYLTVGLEEAKICLGAGDIGIFDAGVSMLLENRGEEPLVSYQISFYADRNLSSLGLPAVMRGASDLRVRFAAAYEGYMTRGTAYRLRARIATYELLDALFAKQAEGRFGRAGARLATVTEYIGKNYASPLSLSTLSRAVGYSPSYLRELFRNELGLSPVRYINRLRVERACALLHEDIPIWQVAELVGCPNANYFSRLFRAEMGITPGEYKIKCL
ncbi:MAG: helix-turn-helix domain-containing protein [Clostridia bacterium]|nr:helix-turn-helix domain-containing protein [Clostridia bacterium]